ncbi:serine 3-dehydrogenase (NADP+) [Thermotomaculum hydrothermale]|uniref:Serine 3-dehydrogenase (NADP+) n=1 Tax=Thermotomaculum hydrothermale TaxID=981385 RepID=A0A7R6PDJ9_9BACT|nr:SDR family oxidoreductase [Thermotomaculum hydrothermale]BBB31774.1 serine 3-dehydrogenase (NADP+) [Thermotomaculum hydrothermale]
MKLKDKIAVITGATAGIGKATAEYFAREGCNLVLIARRVERLEALKSTLEEKYKVKVFIGKVDVSDFSQCEAFFNSLPDELKAPDILVNNAGLAYGMEKLIEKPVEDIDKMFDVNVKGLIYITNLFVPQMVKKGKGSIVNVGSIAGREVYPGGNVYCATKHAVKALSRALRIELVDTPLRVIEIAPGLVETEFSVVRFKGDKEKAANVYKGLTPLYPEDIADLILYTVTRPPHVQINEVIIMPTNQATTTIIHRENNE